jgi:cell division protein FtsL
MQETETLTRERRYIYNGEARPTTSGYAVRPNRRGEQRKVSTFNIILLLFALGIAIVLYINNILAVNQLMSETHQLDTRLKELQGIIELLRSEVSTKGSLDRIGPVARERLGLQSQGQPILIDVDTKQVEKLK